MMHCQPPEVTDVGGGGGEHVHQAPFLPFLVGAVLRLFSCGALVCSYVLVLCLCALVRYSCRASTPLTPSCLCGGASVVARDVVATLQFDEIALQHHPALRNRRCAVALVGSPCASCCSFVVTFGFTRLTRVRACVCPCRFVSGGSLGVLFVFGQR